MASTGDREGKQVTHDFFLRRALIMVPVFAYALVVIPLVKATRSGVLIGLSAVVLLAYVVVITVVFARRRHRYLRPNTPPRKAESSGPETTSPDAGAV